VIPQYPAPSTQHPDVIVVGAGHAGCEAALAAARMGCRVALLTMRVESIALMPCNPSIGGPAKGHLVREIDALGGQMATAIDESFLQIRMLNTSKGAAVQAPRAQADKLGYQQAMRAALAAEPRLALREATVTDLLVGGSPARVCGVRCADGLELSASRVVLTTGTALRGRLVAGDRIVPGSRHGEPPSLGLSEQLRALGFRLRRLKTGTPPRVRLGSVDFAGAAVHGGSPAPLFFSGWSRERVRRGQWDGQPRFGEPAAARLDWPNPEPTGWRPQLPCWLVHTTAETHALIRQNLDRSPMFDGTIEGTGPRYCPSIEDKVVRFAEKPSHGLFLEPEGWASEEVYVQGANTSLPEDVQLAMLRSIRQLREAEVVRYGYAVEYDAVASDDVGPTLETRHLAGLYVAGQIVGTSGYEEAAAQGLLAGINAALAARGLPDAGVGAFSHHPSPSTQHPADPAAGVLPTAELRSLLRDLENGEPLVLPRALAYAGVMVSDLTGQELAEPYRLLTARAEFRLLLRADTAELRLAPLGARLGLLGGERLAAVERRRDAAAAALRRLAKTTFVPPPATQPPRPPSPDAQHPSPGGGRPPAVNALEYLRRPDGSIEALVERVEGLPSDGETRELVQTEARYAGYVARQRAQAERRQRLDLARLPAGAERAAGLRREAREQLARYRPRTVGEAASLAGVTPADVAALLVALRAPARGLAPGQRES
jgi:tRNA uridine 5-carboxymethylaminomethyl modification enzyme